ncbi:MAG: hypothetical protein KIT83_20165 [Bryobacterales bacterium]|nr:hypothetical protein [Bryobacterales bacterium]
MAKGSIDRLNETLDAIATVAASKPKLFTGISQKKLKSHLVNTLQKDPYFDLEEISQDIALGGVRLIKVGSATDLRHAKRLTLLLHRVMGYHSSSQTRAYKSAIKDLDEQRTMTELGNQLARGVRLMFDSLRDWMMKTAAVDGGSVNQYYNQGEDSRLNAMDLTENGWCLGVSTQWVRFKATNRNDFWTWMRTEEGAAAFRFVMAGQGVRTSGGHSLSDRAAFALKRFGVIQQKVLTCDQAIATPEAMALNIGRFGQSYCRIGQLYVGGGGHAMAAWCGSKVQFMDPNAGELQFPGVAQLQSWLPKFVRKMGYHFSRHYVEHYSYFPNLARVDEEKPKTTEDILRDAMAQRRKAMGYGA